MYLLNINAAELARASFAEPEFHVSGKIYFRPSVLMRTPVTPCRGHPFWSPVLSAGYRIRPHPPPRPGWRSRPLGPSASSRSRLLSRSRSRSRCALASAIGTCLRLLYPPLGSFSHSASPESPLEAAELSSRFCCARRSNAPIANLYLSRSCNIIQYTYFQSAHQLHTDNGN